MSDSSTIPSEEEASKAQKGKGKNVQPRTLQLRSDGEKEETVSKSSVDRGGCTSADGLLQQMIVMSLQAQQWHERDTMLEEEELQLLKQQLKAQSEQASKDRLALITECQKSREEQTRVSNDLHNKEIKRQEKLRKEEEARQDRIQKTEEDRMEKLRIAEEEKRTAEGKAELERQEKWKQESLECEEKERKRQLVETAMSNFSKLDKPDT